MGNDNKKDGQKTVAREGPLVQSVSKPMFGASMHQLLVLVPDTSGSMSGGPISEVNAASVNLVAELANPKNRGAFYVACVVYADSAKELLAPKRAADVQPAELTATVGMVGTWTNIPAGLSLALSIIERPPPEGGNWAKPIVVFLSDGHNTDTESPEVIATRIKAKADILAVGFGPSADMDLLRRVATSPQHVFPCGTGTGELRRFFVMVGRTMSQSMQTGQNAAAILGGGGVVRG